MNSNILEKAATDLLSIPPLIFRITRKKLLQTTLTDIEVDITPHHFEIMRLLRDEGTLHVAEIGKRLQIAKAQMTHLIDKLVDLNMVERKPDKLDRRAITITLTKLGKRFLKEHMESLMANIQETMSCLTDEELQNVSNSLRKLRDILLRLQ